MSLKVTVRDLLKAQEAIVVLSACSIPNVKGSYALTKLRRQAGIALDDVEKQRIDRCIHHSIKKDGEPVIQKGEYQFADRAAFEADWKQLCDESVELPGCRAIAIDELSGVTIAVRDAKGAFVESIEGLSPDLLDQLGPFVVEGSA
jgi:hypothetical protein